MNKRLSENHYQLVVVLFPSKEKSNSRIEKNHCYSFPSRRSVFENAYDSIAKGTNANPGTSSSGVNEKKTLSSD